MSIEPTLSIIIVNHRSQSLLAGCLESIAANDFSGETEIIIVDNPPAPETIDNKLVSELDVIRIPTTGWLGFAESANIGAAGAKADYLMFLNPDVKLDREAISNLYAALKNNPQAAIASGRLRDIKGEFQPTCRNFPTLKNLFFSRGSFWYLLSRFSSKKYTLPDYPKTTSVEATAATMILISRRHFETIGGFDPSFFLYMEDTDFCYRAAEQGLETLHVPGAGGEHIWGYSTGHYRFRRIIWHHKSIRTYFAKRRQTVVFFAALLPMLIANCLLSLLIELFKLRK